MTDNYDYKARSVELSDILAERIQKYYDLEKLYLDTSAKNAALSHDKLILTHERDEWRRRYGKARKLLESAWDMGVQRELDEDPDLREVVNIL